MLDVIWHGAGPQQTTDRHCYRWTTSDPTPWNSAGSPPSVRRPPLCPPPLNPRPRTELAGGVPDCCRLFLKFVCVLRVADNKELVREHFVTSASSPLAV